MTAQLHLPVHALTLQLLLQHAQRLVDVVVTNDDLHDLAFRALAMTSSPCRSAGQGCQAARQPTTQRVIRTDNPPGATINRAGRHQLYRVGRAGTCASSIAVPADLGVRQSLPGALGRVHHHFRRCHDAAHQRFRAGVALWPDEFLTPFHAYLRAWRSSAGRSRGARRGPVGPPFPFSGRVTGGPPYPRAESLNRSSVRYVKDTLRDGLVTTVLTRRKLQMGAAGVGRLRNVGFTARLLSSGFQGQRCRRRQLSCTDIGGF